MNGVVPQ